MTQASHRRAAHAIALIAAMACACVGLPPSPPQQDDSTSVGGQSTSQGEGTSSTSAGNTADSVGDTTWGTGGMQTPCGDGVVELPEECDLGSLNGMGMYCTEDCTTNICGDGYVGPGEACDEGEDNSTSGACLPSCVVATCGDTFIHEGVEPCDGNNTNGDDCTTQGFDGGELLCTDDCTTFDTSSCYRCGDGAIDPGEACDGAMLDGEDCLSQGFDAGTLACSASCSFDTSGCMSFACGNGVIDGADECDGAQFGGATCASEIGPGSSGTLMCDAMDCTIDTADCCFPGGHPCTSNADCCDGTCNGNGGTQC